MSKSTNSHPCNHPATALKPVMVEGCFSHFKCGKCADVDITPDGEIIPKEDK